MEYGIVLPLFVGTWLVANHLPDYFLGGTWDHRKQIDVSMEKEEAELRLQWGFVRQHFSKC